MNMTKLNQNNQVNLIIINKLLNFSKIKKNTILYHLGDERMRYKNEKERKLLYCVFHPLDYFQCEKYVSYIKIRRNLKLLFKIDDIKNDIVKHRYVLLGFLSWLLLLPLALTSSDHMIRKLKMNWKRLHRLIYLIAILGILHFIWLVKKDITEPLIYGSIIFILFLLRLNVFKRKRN